MMKSARFMLTALFVLVFVTASFAAPLATKQLSASSMNATAQPFNPNGTVSNELDEPVILFDFEVENLDDWTWGNGSIQDSYWAADDYAPHGGSNSWRAFDPEVGPNGGYESTWFQNAITPAVDLTTTTSPELTFWFKLACEDPSEVDIEGYDGWDGANFWIRYTNDADEVVTEVIDTFTGPDYDGDSFFSFGYEWFLGPNIPAWGGVHDWSEVTADLSAYTGYDDVQILFAFCSDPAFDTNDDATLTGYQIDDIEIADGETVLFADDAEDPDNTEMTFEGGFDTTVGNEFALLDGQADAPSPTHVVEVDHQEHGYRHYLESPAFDLPEVEDGQRLYFDISVNSDMQSPDDSDFYPRWYLEIYDPEEDDWDNADDIRQINEASTFVGPSNGWSLVSGFGATEDDVVLEGTPLAGLNGVKMRIYFSSVSEDYTFNYCMWDNFTYELRGVQNDVSTDMVLIPYPVTVGLPNAGSVHYSNNGVNEATFTALWGVNVASTPGIPGPSITLAAGEQTVMTIDTPNDEFTGWVPAANLGGTTVNLTARAFLSGDEEIANDRDTTSVAVGNAGEHEFAYDNHEVAWFYTMNNANTGPMTHFVMNQTNSHFDDAALNISYVGVQWYAANETQANWPAEGVPFRIHVFEGGDTPGTELVNEEITVNTSGGTFGWAGVDVSDIEAFQNSVAADFYVWVELYSTVSNGTSDVIQPSVLADEINTGELYPDNNLFYNGTEVTEAGYASFIHVLADEVVDSADEPVVGEIPGEFALAQAYPNPFNPTTTLRYDVARTGRVSLKVFNVMGQEVASLVDRQIRAGSHTVTFDGSSLSSGVYFVRMQAEGFNATQKIMLMK